MTKLLLEAAFLHEVSYLVHAELANENEDNTSQTDITGTAWKESVVVMIMMILKCFPSA